MSEPSEDLKNRFGFHPANDPAVQEQHSEVRSLLLDVAATLDASLPPGREHAVVLTKLEEVMFWSNAAIARHSSPLG